MKKKTTQVKEYVQKLENETVHVNLIYWVLTGCHMGAIWHKPIMDVSKSTIRRALNELVEAGHYESYYAIGHCYDIKLYRRLDE